MICKKNGQSTCWIRNDAPETRYECRLLTNFCIRPPPSAATSEVFSLSFLMAATGPTEATATAKMRLNAAETLMAEGLMGLYQ